MFRISFIEDNPVETTTGFPVLIISSIISKFVISPDPILKNLRYLENNEINFTSHIDALKSFSDLFANMPTLNTDLFLV